MSARFDTPSLLLVSESYWPNADGGAVFERRLARGLRSRGWNVRVWAPATRAGRYVEEDDGVAVQRESSTVLLGNPAYRVSVNPWRRVREVFDWARPSVVHIHNAGPLGLAALRQASRQQLGVVATNHFMPENLLMNLPALAHSRRADKLLWRFLTWFHERADLVTAPTATAMSLLRRHGLTAPGAVITNGVETADLQWTPAGEEELDRLSIPRDRALVVYLGRVNREKRIDDLLEAHARAVRSRSAHLVVAGTGNAARRCEERVRRLGIGRTVSLPGYISDAAKAVLLRRAHVFVMPSACELQSIATLEAMSCGAPVVAVDAVALPELVRSGSTGLLTRVGDTARMAAAIELLLDDRSLAKRLSCEAQRLVQRSHTSDHMLRGYEEALTSVADQGGVAPLRRGAPVAVELGRRGG